MAKTDTLLYLAARNEHVKNKIEPALSKGKVVICDRFIDSTLAYQVYGKKVSLGLINSIHKHILKKNKPDLTFVLKVNVSKALKRLNKRKNKNRYDKFNYAFYNKVQNGFLKISKNKNKYMLIDSNASIHSNKQKIFDKINSIT